MCSDRALDEVVNRNKETKIINRCLSLVRNVGNTESPGFPAPLPFNNTKRRYYFARVQELTGNESSPLGQERNPLPDIAAQALSWYYNVGPPIPLALLLD